MSKARTLPQSPFMTIEEVLAFTGYRGRATIYKKMIEDNFPGSVALGGMRKNGRSCRAMWLRDEVEKWVADQIAASRQVLPA